MLRNQAWLNLDHRKPMKLVTPILWVIVQFSLLGCGGGEESSPLTSNLSTAKNVTEGSPSGRTLDSAETSQSDQTWPTPSSPTEISDDSLPAESSDSAEDNALPPPILFSEEEPMLTTIPPDPGVSVHINWDHSPDSNITSYYVYYGKQPTTQPGSCSYEESQSVETPPATISGLEPNTPYFFAISAFNESESSCSPEIMMVTPPVRPEELS